MRKLLYLLLFISVLSCSKDEDPPAKVLITPVLSWEMSSVTNNFLEISITINSTESLPSGKLEFKVDNELIDTFTPSKSTKIFTTSYSFEDINEHSASLIYSFTDGRASINKSIKIKKVLNETVIRSFKENWTDF
jgi:hypothetical protein